jgi:hypothetical protein
MKNVSLLKYAIGTILILLILNLFIAFSGTASKSMARGKNDYRVVRVTMNTQAMQLMLNQYSEDGWELVALDSPQGHMIFKK